MGRTAITRPEPQSNEDGQHARRGIGAAPEGKGPQDRQGDARSEAREEEEIQEIRDAVAEAIHEGEAHATNEEVIQ